MIQNMSVTPDSFPLGTRIIVIIETTDIGDYQASCVLDDKYVILEDKNFENTKIISFPFDTSNLADLDLGIGGHVLKARVSSLSSEHRGETEIIARSITVTPIPINVMTFSHEAQLLVIGTALGVISSMLTAVVTVLLANWRDEKALELEIKKSTNNQIKNQSYRRRQHLRKT